MPHVTVVIPAYNGVRRYLAEAIQSVLAQSHRDVEIIVVDDASTDDTSGLVGKYPVRCVRHVVNRGQAAARNEGARHAGSELLAFLDQDDLWEPTFLEETCAAIMQNPDAAMVHADGYQVSEQNAILHYDAAMKWSPTITQLLRGGHDAATSGSLFRKTCFDALAGYDESLPIWEDIDLAIRLYQRYPLVHLAKPLYRHRLYGHNASRDIPSERALFGRRRFLDKYSAACRAGTPEGRALRKDWARYYSDLGKYHMREGRMSEARRALRLSVKYVPLSPKAWLRMGRSFLIRGRQA
ncbi:MAG TPA: glycosyltransferase [Nitrospiraceae bacterium]|nr:glycosyltransferase [Nitrospiraceae bacterium]